MAQRRVSWLLAITAVAGPLAIAAIGTAGQRAQAQHTSVVSEPASTAPTFAPIAATIRHPRCMNCHTSTDFPRQNDERRRHLLGVVRGTDDHGTAGLPCSSCHGERNNDVGGVPGAPHWGLAPLSMAWEYMTDVEICQQLKDRSRNGDKSLAELHRHMTEDPLVLWAWEPGLHPGGEPRSLPPYGLEEFHAAMMRWVDAEAPCTTEDVQ